jgi:hypothetical protein
MVVISCAQEMKTLSQCATFLNASKEINVTKAKKPEAELPLPRLKKLLAEATALPWRVSSSSMGSTESVYITAYEREGITRSTEDGDGPIAHVPTKRSHYEKNNKKARYDADLIVTAVNALPELIRRLGLDVDESAWLIEFPADKYGPVRYWAAGEELPVIDVDHATRFARKEDAAAIIRMLNFNTGWQQAVKPAEHLWVKGHK